MPNTGSEHRDDSQKGYSINYQAMALRNDMSLSHLCPLGCRNWFLTRHRGLDRVLGDLQTGIRTSEPKGKFARLVPLESFQRRAALHRQKFLATPDWKDFIKSRPNVPYMPCFSTIGMRAA